jgi:hypothetical protein
MTVRWSISSWPVVAAVVRTKAVVVVVAATGPQSRANHLVAERQPSRLHLLWQRLTRCQLV